MGWPAPISLLSGGSGFPGIPLILRGQTGAPGGSFYFSKTGWPGMARNEQPRIRLRNRDETDLLKVGVACSTSLLSSRILPCLSEAPPSIDSWGAPPRSACCRAGIAFFQIDIPGLPLMLRGQTGAPGGSLYFSRTGWPGMARNEQPRIKLIRSFKGGVACSISLLSGGNGSLSAFLWLGIPGLPLILRGQTGAPGGSFYFSRTGWPGMARNEQPRIKLIGSFNGPGGLLDQPAVEQDIARSSDSPLSVNRLQPINCATGCASANLVVSLDEVNWRNP